MQGGSRVLDYMLEDVATSTGANQEDNLNHYAFTYSITKILALCMINLYFPKVVSQQIDKSIVNLFIG